MKVIKNPKLVKIEWTDAHNNNGQWFTHDEILEFAKEDIFHCTHVGWLVYENEECIVVASRKDKQGEQYGLIERIPKRMIESQKDLESTKEKE